MGGHSSSPWHPAHCATSRLAASPRPSPTARPSTSLTHCGCVPQEYSKRCLAYSLAESCPAHRGRTSQPDSNSVHASCGKAGPRPAVPGTGRTRPTCTPDAAQPMCMPVVQDIPVPSPRLRRISPAKHRSREERVRSFKHASVSPPRPLFVVPQGSRRSPSVQSKVRMAKPSPKSRLCSSCSIGNGDGDSGGILLLLAMRLPAFRFFSTYAART
eukprot:scaffold30832_cov67-Phaeocystis_antarctica.AAC.15